MNVARAVVSLKGITCTHSACIEYRLPSWVYHPL